MKRTFMLIVIGTLVLVGWAWAREQEMLNHPADIHMEEMQDASCPASSSPPGST